MKVPNTPIEVVNKNGLLAHLKNLKPETDFNRILVTDRGRPCAVILSIPDWTRISQKWNTLNEWVRKLRMDRRKRLGR